MLYAMESMRLFVNKIIQGFCNASGDYCEELNLLDFHVEREKRYGGTVASARFECFIRPDVIC